MDRRRRLLTTTVGLVVALVAATGLTACEPPPDTYVALGDSFVAGPLIPGQRNDPAGCMRSNRNYPSLISGNLATTEFVDVSCSGARTRDLHAPQDVNPGPANAPQLDALDRQTKVVTLGIGGNDIGFSDIVVTCATSLPLSGGCRSTYVRNGHDELRQRIADTAPAIDSALAEIKTRAPRASVFVVGYPTVVPETGHGCYPVVPVLPGDVPYLRGVVKDLNAMLRDRAAAAGATYVDVATPSIGHDVCQLPGRKWIEGLVPTSLAAPIHPNSIGMRGMATPVAATINRVVPN